MSNKRMTRRERLTAIFEGRTPDRPAVKIWGATPDGPLAHPAFAPVRELAVAKTDLFRGTGSPFSSCSTWRRIGRQHTLQSST